MRHVWLLAVLVSLGLHGALLAGALVTWAQKPAPDQSPSEARLDIAAQPVAASKAKAAAAASEATAAASADGQRVDGSAIPQSVAQAGRPASAAAPAVPVAAAFLSAAAPAGGQRVNGSAIPQSVVQAGRPTSAVAPAVPVAAAVLAAAAPVLPSAQPIAPNPDSVVAASISGQEASDIAIPQSPVPVSRPAAEAALTVTDASDMLAAVQSSGPVALPAPPNALPANAAAPDTVLALTLAPPSEFRTASLAWVGDQGTLDPVSLAAIQAFMQSGDLALSDANSGRLRDGIANALSAVPCARLQTSFDPETGSIDLRGHLPDDGLRAPVLAALQAQVGSALPVRDRVRLLRRPLCQVLGAIAQTGLAQSTEQDTNPRIVGPDTFVRDYDLRAGQQVVFDMTAPDYPAVIYVDYFDAAGNVLHMQPNDQVPQTLHAPKSTLAVGKAAPGVPALQLIVSPPYGQEIAVAFATSVPLYAGVRPTVEAAEPYLAFLSGAVEKTRVATPDFKGEWVYFFVTTGP